LNAPKEIIGQWISPEGKKTYTLNGAPYNVTFRGIKVQIYKHNDNRMFLLSLYDDQSGVPIELIAITNTPLRFETKNKHNPTS